MKIQVFYNVELENDETPKVLAKRCQNLDCPCKDILDTTKQCLLGSDKVTGLCRLTTESEWICCLSHYKHNSYSKGYF